MKRCYPLHIFPWTVNFSVAIILVTAGCFLDYWIAIGFGFLFAFISAFFVHSNEGKYWAEKAKQ